MLALDDVDKFYILIYHFEFCDDEKSVDSGTFVYCSVVLL